MSLFNVSRYLKRKLLRAEPTLVYMTPSKDGFADRGAG